MKKVIIMAVLALSVAMAANANDCSNKRCRFSSGFKIWCSAEVEGVRERLKFKTLDQGKFRLPYRNDGKPTGNEPRITNPEGTSYNLAWGGHTDTNFGEITFYGLKGEMVKSDDGKTVYFMNIMPDVQDYWLKGEIDADRNVVVIENDQLIAEWDGIKCYFVGLPNPVGEDGFSEQPGNNNTAAAPDKIEIPLREDGGIDCTGYWFWLWTYTRLNDVTDAVAEEGYYSYSYSMLGIPVGEPVTPPAGVEPEKYLLTAGDVFESLDNPCPVTYLVGLIRDGEKVYVQGLGGYSPDSYVEGIIKSNELSIKSGQLLLDKRDRFYFKLFGAENLREDYSFNPYFPLFCDFTDEIKFVIDGNTMKMEEGKGLACYYVEPELSGPWMLINTSLSEYAGDRPAAPQNVSELDYKDYFNDFGFSYLSFRFRNVDAQTDEWINPAACSFELYFDDELYTFTKDQFDLGGSESMSRIPLLFNSSDFTAVNAFNTDPQGSYFNMHFNDADKKWLVMKIRIVYTDKNGMEHFSEFASLDHPIELTVDNFRLTNNENWIASGTDFSVTCDLTCHEGKFNNTVIATIYDEEDNIVTSISSEKLQMSRGEGKHGFVIAGNLKRVQKGKTYKCDLSAYTNGYQELLTPEKITFRVGGPSGVESVEDYEIVNVEYFNLQGISLGDMIQTPGVYVKVTTTGDGRKVTEKAIVK